MLDSVSIYVKIKLILISHIAQPLLIRKFYCLRPGSHISFKYVSLNILVHDVINLLYYSVSIVNFEQLFPETLQFLGTIYEVIYKKLSSMMENQISVEIFFNDISSCDAIQYKIQVFTSISSSSYCFSNDLTK